MRLDDLPESGNVEDRRSEEGSSRSSGGFGLPIGGGGLGIGTIVVLGLIGWALGIDPRLLIGGAEMVNGTTHRVDNSAPSGARRTTGTPSDEAGRFVSRILGSTEAVWKDVFTRDGRTYRPPVLVLYRDVTDASCGGPAQKSMGPFYCPVDQKVYLDTSFFRELETRFGGCGGKSCQFSQAYVIAHEVGHHVQNLLGILPKAQRAQQSAGSRADANAVQVRVELQADCLAGVWAKHQNDAETSQGKPPFIDQGDVAGALQTAAAIGDDTLQKKAQGYAVPDSFTHGSSQQRQRWVTTGLRQGTVAGCNTFDAANL
jgi:hypothetical protein